MLSKNDLNCYSALSKKKYGTQHDKAPLSWMKYFMKKSFINVFVFVFFKYRLVRRLTFKKKKRCVILERFLFRLFLTPFVTSYKWTPFSVTKAGVFTVFLLGELPVIFIATKHIFVTVSRPFFGYVIYKKNHSINERSLIWDH